MSNPTFRSENDFSQVLVSGSSTATSISNEESYPNVARLATSEFSVGRGNALLDAYARNQSGGGPVLFVNRSAPIAGAAAVAGAPAMIESPCFHFHPYGALTDVSVCLVLRAVQGLAHGPETVQI